MRTSEFCYWLQGYFELSGDKALNERKVEVIKRHLNLVFVHDLDPKQIKEKLQMMHDGPEPSPSTCGEEVYRC